MRKRLIFFLIFVSTNCLSADFKSFADYKNNNALLASDIERLESFEGQKHNQVFVETINQYKILLENYERINTRLTLQSFADDAKENGWINISTKALERVAICEGLEIDLTKCLYELGQLKVFVTGSNLHAESKESVIGFIDNYIEESTQLAVFDEKFISSFNEHSQLSNSLITPLIAAPAMTVKITPVAKKTLSRVKPLVQTADMDLVNYYVLASLFILLACIFFYKRKRKLNSLKVFYSRIFWVARKSKLNVKLFGYIDLSSLNVVKKIEKPFLESVQQFYTFAPEVHLKFKSKKNELKVETLFFSNRSLSGSVQKEADVLKDKLENLQEAVNLMGGELLYCNNFNIKGEIVNSNLTMTLPIN